MIFEETTVKISDFDYNLPEERIAIYPPEIRGNSRLLVLDRQIGQIQDKSYRDIIDFMSEGDVLVLNKTKVIKARILAHLKNGKDIELIVLEKHGDELLDYQQALYKGKLTEGDIVFINNNEFKVIEILGNGIAVFSGSKKFGELLDSSGKVPIPPYLHRKSEVVDEERYQTVFAKEDGSVAAPTASLNFTKDLEKRILDKGIKIVYLTLHVGLGTFLPVRTDDVAEHNMHSEFFYIEKETAETIRTARNNKNKIIALGTTVTRTLEFNADKILDENIQEDLSGEADIFIYPGYNFKIVDKLITNFHAPRSTVLLLVNAFADPENIKIAYNHAINEKYEFLSYGDSMMII